MNEVLSTIVAFGMLAFSYLFFQGLREQAFLAFQALERGGDSLERLGGEMSTYVSSEFILSVLVAIILILLAISFRLDSKKDSQNIDRMSRNQEPSE